MAIGNRIRYFRKLRGLTQTQLGELLGFSELTAHVRITQYETSQKISKADTLQNIASALKVDVSALVIPYDDNPAASCNCSFFWKMNTQ